MTDPLRVTAGELTSDEILDALEDGHRVVVRTEMLGSDHEVTLRHDGDVYYCDTPTTLHRHDDTAGMRQCLLEQGYASDA
jgi:hemin uptake protein HemP